MKKRTTGARQKKIVAGPSPKPRRTKPIEFVGDTASPSPGSDPETPTPSKPLKKRKKRKK